MEPNIQLRRASLDQTEELKAFTNRVFKYQLSEALPHLFSPERMPEHIIAEIDGRIAGSVGLYPHEFRHGDLTFNVAGIGQVGTDPDFRGLGIMSRMLKEAQESADTFDFTYLFGDQLRYSNYGWSIGGKKYICETFDRYLPESPLFSEVRPMDMVADIGLIRRGIEHMPQRSLFPENQLAMFLNGARPKIWTGWKLGESFILGPEGGTRIILADGPAEDLLVLLGFASRAIRKQEGDRWKLEIQCDPIPNPLLQVATRHAWTMAIHPSVNLRIGNLVSFLGKALHRVEGCLTPHSVAIRNSDTGHTVSVSFSKRDVTVEESTQEDAYVLNTRQISEICFGLAPIDLLLPGLCEDSPLRRVLPFPVHFSHVLGV